MLGKRRAGIDAFGSRPRLPAATPPPPRPVKHREEPQAVAAPVPAVWGTARGSEGARERGKGGGRTVRRDGGREAASHPQPRRKREKG